MGRTRFLSKFLQKSKKNILQSCTNHTLISFKNAYAKKSSVPLVLKHHNTSLIPWSTCLLLTLNYFGSVACSRNQHGGVQLSSWFFTLFVMLIFWLFLIKNILIFVRLFLLLLYLCAISYSLYLHLSSLRHFMLCFSICIIILTVF